MKIFRRLSLLMAAFMLIAFCTTIQAPIANAAGSARTISFTSTNTGIEVGKKDQVTFRAQLDTPNVSGLIVEDEAGHKVATLQETAAGIYEATVEITANTRTKHTYTLNTVNADEHTCDMNFYNPLTAADIANDELTWSKVKKISATITEENKLATVDAIYSALKNDKNVEDVWYESPTTLNFITADGLLKIYDAEMRLQRGKTLTQPQTNTVIDINATESDVAAAQTAKEATKADSNVIGTRNICILAPFYGVEIDFTDICHYEAENLITAMGGGTSDEYYGDGSLTGKKCDISSFKNLDKYGIIMVDSHGTLCYGQNVICVYYGTGASSADYSSNRLVEAEDDLGKYIALMPSFITHYTKSLPNSLVWLGTCYGMNKSYLSDAFLGLGASFITGFSQSVSFVFEKQLLSEYCKGLRAIDPETQQYNTVKQAFDSAAARFGKIDPYGSESAIWKYKGNTNLRIQEKEVAVPITAVEVTTPKTKIGIGEKVQLSVSITPAAAIEQCTIEWSSFDEEIATVTSSGLVEGIAEGNTRIGCSVTDADGTTLLSSIVINVKGEEAPAFNIGDVNKDEKVNTADATAILKHCASMITLDQEQITLADFNKDGKVNTADAVALLKSLI